MRKLLFFLAFLPVFAYGQATKTTATFDHVRARASLRIGSGSSTAATGIANVMPATPSTQLITAAGVYNWFTGTITFAGDVAGPYNNLQIGTGTVGANELASTTVTAGTYGSGSLVPVVTVDADGRVTGVTTAAVSGGGGAGIDTLPTYASMRSYTGAANLIAMRSYAKVEGGIFTRTSIGTENGGTLIVATNGVKWKRQFDGLTYYPEFWEVGGYDETGVVSGITDITEAIQAAINVASPIGGTVILRKPYSPYNVVGKVNNISLTGKGCVEIKSNLTFLISPGVILQKANGAQTDAIGPVSVVYGDTLSNVIIGGGGTIDGNCAGQPGWTGGYGQAGVQGAGIFIAQFNAIDGLFTNSNIIIKDLTVVDHFSSSAEIANVNGLYIDNYYFADCGEGFGLGRCNNVNCNNITGVGGTIEQGDGLEIAACSNVNCTNIYITGWKAATALEFYSTVNANVSNFILTGNDATVGIGMATRPGPPPRSSENLSFNDGYIGGMFTGIYVNDGDVKLSNITFDSCAIGVIIEQGASPSISLKKDAVISNCTFKNRPAGSTGILGTANKTVFVSNCVFHEMYDGIVSTGSATSLTPKFYINSCHFSKITRNGIMFDPNGQGGYIPKSLIAGCDFTKITNNPINLPTNRQDIRISEMVYDSIYVYTSATSAISTNTMYLTTASPNTITDLPVGTDGQELTFLSNFPIFNAKTIAPGGNIKTVGLVPFAMVQSSGIKLKYSAVGSTWLEVSRFQAGDLFSTTTATLERKYFLPDWSVENVGAASQTNIIVVRLNLNTYGKDFYIPVGGMVRQLGVISNEAITTGSVTGNLMFSGTGPIGTVSLSGGQASNISAFGRYNKAFNAGTFIGVTFTTSATYAHPNADILVWMEIEY